MISEFIPRERLRVFISSAQNNEGEFSWKDVRDRVKTRLSECPYINPYIIEDVASESPSNQEFEYQVERADIVITLVKGEVRQGTARELTVATRCQKPLLLYFLSEQHPSLEVQQLKKYVQAHDYCTYRNLDTFEKIEEHVFKDVLENLITYYQKKHYQYQSSALPEQIVSITRDDIFHDHTINMPTKSAIDMFASSYAHAFDLLDANYLKNIEEVNLSPLHTLGIAAIEWLVNGTPIKSNDDILQLIDYARSIYEKTDWLTKRWDAILNEMSDNPAKALEAEKQALEIARAEKLPNWIIDDILIDCRNIEIEIGNVNHQLVYGTDIQNELTNRDTIVSMPILDRYKESVYSDILQEEKRIDTKPPYTTHYGSRLGSIITNVINYYFAAMIYGSYTHMFLARKELADAFYKYGVIWEDESVYLVAIKLLVLQGETSDFKLIVESKWDIIYSAITANANDLWKLTDSTHISGRNSMKLEVLTRLGMYLTDDVFMNGLQFLKSIVPQIYWGNSEPFFECVRDNAYRIGSEGVIALIIDIIRDQRFHLGSTLSAIIHQLHLEDVAPTIQRDFCSVLKEKLSFIIGHNGDPQIIATLERQNQEFSVLTTLPDNGLVDYQKVLYEINMDRGNWCDVLSTEIAIAKAEFERDKASRVITYSFLQPYRIIIQAVRERYTPEMDTVLSNEFFPLCAEILNSTVNIELKSRCVDGLCEVTAFWKNTGHIIPPTLVAAIGNANSNIDEEILLPSDSSEQNFYCRLLILKIIVGLKKQDALLSYCVEYRKMDIQKRIAFSKCIEQYLHYQSAPYEIADILILSCILQCFEDESYLARWYACSSLTSLIETSHRNTVVEKLCSASIDPSHHIRMNIVTLCKKQVIKDKDIVGRLLNILKDDAHYTIRNYAQQLAQPSC